MHQKPVLCTCSKRFKTNGALRQHQRDSPLHVDRPQAPERKLRLDELVQRLPLQDQEADQRFIWFSGGGPPNFFARNPNLRISSWPEVAAPNLAPEPATAGEKNVLSSEGTKKKKKVRENILKMGRDRSSSWQVNANTGQMTDLLEDQDWALCDKDCGWCGHCAQGVLY